MSLHWLPLKARIQYKVLLLVFKALHGLAPEYISQLLTTYKPLRSLRSANEHLLVEPRANLATVGDRAFSVYAPRLWNKLPSGIRHADGLPQFKSTFKAHLFQSIYQKQEICAERL